MDTYHENPRYLFSFGMPKLTLMTWCHFCLLNTVGSTQNISIHVVHGVGKNIKFHSLNGTLFFTHVPEKYSGNEQPEFSHFSSQPSYLRTYFKVRANLGLPTTQTIGSSKLQYLLGIDPEFQFPPISSYFSPKLLFPILPFFLQPCKLKLDNLI